MPWICWTQIKIVTQSPVYLLYTIYTWHILFFLSMCLVGTCAGEGTCECVAFLTANTDISVCLSHQERPCLYQSKYNWAGQTVRVHATKVPFWTSLSQAKNKYPTSKHAASGPFPRLSPSQLKLPLHCRVSFEYAAKSKGCFEHGSPC